MSWWLVSIGSFVALLGAGLAAADEMQVGAAFGVLAAVLLYFGIKIGKF